MNQNLRPHNPSRNGYPEHAGNPNATAKAPEEGSIPINGYAQVIEMLTVADAAFRESILQRLSARDRELGKALRAEMIKLGL